MSQSSEQKRKEVFDTVAGEWMPIFRGTIQLLQSRFSDGTYDNSRTILIRDLKSDVGLYLPVIRALYRHDSSLGFLPWEILSQAPLDTIYTAIRQAYQIGSKHDYKKMSDYQESRIQQMLISALFSEHLAAKNTAIDPEVTYVVCLLRQLGLTLLSWNYPDEYAAAVKKDDTTSGVIDSLNSSLGFNLNLLTSDLVENWRLPTELALAVSSGKEVGDTGIFEVTGTGCFKVIESDLKLLCDDAELISEACHLQSGKLSEAKSTRVKELLTDTLDESSFSSALEEGNELVSSYKRYCIFEVSPTSREAIMKRMLSGKRAQALLERNSYLRNIPELAYDNINYLYSYLNPGKISEELVRKILAKIFYALGFELVHVYFYDSAQKLLNPSISIVGPTLDDSPSIPTESAVVSDELLRSAFQLGSLLHMERMNRDGELVMAIAARIGDDDSSGVLYVESPSETLLKSGLSPLAMFRAAFKSIADTLEVC